MEKSQLTTIVVTAIISVTAKEVFTWFVSLIKNLSINITIKAKLSKIFTLTNISILWDIILLSGSVWALIMLLHKAPPLTGFDVLFIVLTTLIMIIYTGSLLFRIAFYYYKKKPKK